MQKLIEVQSAKDFASTFLNDIFFKMAVNRVLDNCPRVELVHCGSCIYARYETDDGWLWCNRWKEASECGGYCHKGEKKP